MIQNNKFLCTVYHCFHIFFCLIFWLYLSSPFFPIDPLHAVNSLPSHSSYYFLHPRIRGLSFLLLDNNLCIEYRCFRIFLWLKFYFLLHSSLWIHSMLLISFTLIPFVTSCIHEFRHFPLLHSSGHHFKFFWSSLSSLFARDHTSLTVRILRDPKPNS